MKNKLLIVWTLILLSVTPTAHAGFLVKKTAIAAPAHIATSAKTSTSVLVHEKNTGFFNKLHKHLSVFHPYQFHKQNQWVGIAAMGCGILGLLVPGVNFLAILFGVLGMGRGCKAPGLAVAGFILGILELILFLLIQTVFISLILL